MAEEKVTSYSIYNPKSKNKTKINPLSEIYNELPKKKYEIIYADPPWDYGGKMQYDKSSNKSCNINFKKDIFISSASFKYPTLKLNDLMKLDVASISSEDCLLFMWTTGPHMENAMKLGKAWGFEYKTVAFVWDKMMHNPGQYTLSQTEFCLVFKKGRIPNPRGARNIRQLLAFPRSKHSEKPIKIIENITKMFPSQSKIELFARANYYDWDNWGLEIPDTKVKIPTYEEMTNKDDIK